MECQAKRRVDSGETQDERAIKKRETMPKAPGESNRLAQKWRR
jgi:hypothetical protein